MSKILISEKKLKTLLKEAPVSGDQSASNIAAGKQAVSDVKARLAKMGVYDIPELRGVNTIEQLSIEPFKFTFLLQVSDDQQELTLPKPVQFDTLARVVQVENPLVLEVKTDSGEIFKLAFVNEDEIITRLPGTKENVRALVSEDSRKGKFYTVEGSSDLVPILKKESGEGNSENEEDVNNDGNSDSSEESDNIQKGGKVNKEQLFNDLAGFFKFTYNNRRLAAPQLFPKEKTKTVEYYINSIANNVKLITEEDIEGGNINGKIYVKDIELGPKAKAKRGEDERSYANKNRGGGTSQWNGQVNSLPKGGLKVNINLVLTDESKLNDEQKIVFKQIVNQIGAASHNGSATIRKSNKVTDNTVFIIEFDGKALVCKVAQGQILKKPTQIEIGPKAGGKDIFDKSTTAKIQIS